MRKTKEQRAKANAARSRQEQRTRERGSILLVERTNRVIGPVLLTVPPIPALLLSDAIKEKDAEIFRLRRALVATQVRLERTQASLLPRLRSKAAEVRELRKKAGINATGARASKRLNEAKARAKKLTVSEDVLPPLDKILATNAKAAEREKVKSTAQ